MANKQQMINHFFTMELYRRGLDVRTAASETANAFNIVQNDFDALLLEGTGATTLSNLTQIMGGLIEAGDIVFTLDEMTMQGEVFVSKGGGSVFGHLAVMRNCD